MTIQGEKALRTGRNAWLRGELQTAVESLQKAMRCAEHAPEVVYPLARVMSEQGDKDGALAMLENAASHTHFQHVGEVFRGLILYDHGDTEGAREALSRLNSSNALGVCLIGLLDFDAKKHRKFRVHRGGRWVSDIAGRLLAALEEELHHSQAEADAFHQRLFTSSDDTPLPTNDATPSPDSFDSSSQWWEALEAAMREGDHDRLIAIHDRADVSEKWRDVYSSLFKAFSLLASDRSKTAEALLAKLTQENTTLVWTHFLSGLTAVRRQDRRQAIASFVRAARNADIDMDGVIRKLAQELHIEIEVVD